MIDPSRERVLDSPRLEMAQPREHSGDLSHPSSRTNKRGIDGSHPEHRPGDVAKQTRAYYETVSFSAAGIELGLSVAIGAGLGYWLDGRIGSSPAFMLALTVLGFVAGVRAMMRAGRRASRHARGASQS